MRCILACQLLLVGCYSSWRMEDDALNDTSGPSDDASADRVEADAPGDAADLSCWPQEAMEDPDIDCDGCDPCDATPYRWDGDRCVFAPICCACVGADCDQLFTTHADCLAAYESCPVAWLAPRHGEARLSWQAPGGYAGTGPRLLVDGQGLARLWEWGTGVVELDGTAWERTDWNYAEDLGVEAANLFFDLLAAMELDGLPHPPTGWVECYPALRVRLCDACETVELDYQQAHDLLPEFVRVYALLDDWLCRGIGVHALPGSYCEF